MNGCKRVTKEEVEEAKKRSKKKALIKKGFSEEEAEKIVE